MALWHWELSDAMIIMVAGSTMAEATRSHDDSSITLAVSTVQYKS